jgi:hypothetical protein
MSDPGVPSSMPEILAAIRRIPADELLAARDWFNEQAQDPAEGSPRVREFLAQVATAVGGMACGTDPMTTLEFLNQAGISRN